MEATGVVDVRSGLGTYISRSAGDKLRDGWITWLRAHHDETVEIIAVRKALEQLAASRAANNATPNDIGKLESICDTFERELGKSTPNQRRLADLDIAFHRQIAQIGGGIIIPRLVDEVASVIGRSRRITFAHPGPARAVAADHRRILAAIAAHDPEQAAEALAAHMETIIETLTNLAKGTP
jgi:DNA-binding FadR family transcriptional regulator